MTRGRTKRPKLRPPGELPSAGAVQPWQWFLLAAAVPLAVCASKLNFDLWHDEIYTLDVFVAGGPGKIVTDYSLPNNHVFYSLLIWAVQLISDSSFVLRLPSLIFAAATLWLTFQSARLLGNLPTAVLATVLLGLNQMFLIHVMLVRGYGLSMFLFAWLFYLATRGDGEPKTSRLAQIALVGAAFLYVMPTNLLFFLPLAAVAFAATLRPRANSAPAVPTGRRQVRTRRLFVTAGAWAAAMILAAVCYAPIAGQVFAQRGARTGFSWNGLFATAENFLKPAQHDFWPLVPLFLLGLIAWGIRRARGMARASAALPAAAAAVIAAALVLTAALGISPFPRNFCPLLPMIALVEAWTLGALTESIPWKGPRAEARSAFASALVVAAVLGPQVWSYPDRLAAYCRKHPGAHDGYFNYYAADYHASAVIENIHDRVSDGRPYQVYFSDEDHLNLYYYFQRFGQPLAGANKGASDDSPASIFFIAPALPDWRNLSEKSHLSETALRQFRVLQEFGYYRLYGATDPVAPNGGA